MFSLGIDVADWGIGPYTTAIAVRVRLVGPPASSGFNHCPGAVWFSFFSFSLLSLPRLLYRRLDGTRCKAEVAKTLARMG